MNKEHLAKYSNMLFLELPRKCAIYPLNHQSYYLFKLSKKIYLFTLDHAGSSLLLAFYSTCA